MKSPGRPRENLPSNQQTDEINKTEEKKWVQVEQDKVVSTAEKLGVFLNVPTNTIDRAKQTKAFYVTDEEFNKILFEYLKELTLLREETDKANIIFQEVATTLGTSVENLNKIRLQQISDLEKRLGNFGGIFLHGNIYLKKSSPIPAEIILRHELIHVLVSRDDESNGFQLSNGKHHQLNEGVIQILELAERYKMPPFDLLKKIRAGEIVTPYRSQVEVILLSLSSTEQGNNPMNYKELAKFLFQGESEFFKISLISRLDEKFAEKIKAKFIEYFGI